MRWLQCPTFAQTRNARVVDSRPVPGARSAPPMQANLQVHYTDVTEAALHGSICFILLAKSTTSDNIQRLKASA